MSVTVDDSAVMAEISAMIERLAHPEQLLEMVGTWQEHRIEERIETTKISPDGVPWADWQLRTLKNRQAKPSTLHRGLLWDEGVLLGSFGFEVNGNGVEIGTHLDYAKALQDGYGNMAAREFVGWSPEDLEQLDMMATAFIETGAMP
jgi:phage gpG-like protein